MVLRDASYNVMDLSYDDTAMGSMGPGVSASITSVTSRAPITLLLFWMVRCGWSVTESHVRTVPSRPPDT